MPTFMMDAGLPPPRDELSTSCVIHCLESELYFTVVFIFYVTGVLVRVIIFPPP